MIDRISVVGALIVRRVATTLAFVVCTFLMVAAPASAHAILLSMTPADGSLMMTAPQAVVLTFDAPIQSLGDAVVVTDPEGASVTTGPPVILDATVTQRLASLTVPGRYSVAYRVVSADGHPVERELTFYYRQRTGSATDLPAISGVSPSPTMAVAVVAAIALLVAGLVIWVIRRRSRRHAVVDSAV